MSVQSLSDITGRVISQVTRISRRDGDCIVIRTTDGSAYAMQADGSRGAIGIVSGVSGDINTLICSRVTRAHQKPGVPIYRAALPASIRDASGLASTVITIETPEGSVQFRWVVGSPSGEPANATFRKTSQ